MINHKKRLGIILISPLPPPTGGIATWTKKYLQWTKNNEVELRIINNAVIGIRANALQMQSQIFDEFKRSIQIIKKLVRAIMEFNVPILHINSSCGKYGIIRDYICAKIGKSAKKAVIIHYHCNIEDQLKNKTQIYFFKKLTKLADKVLVLNNDSEVYISESIGIKSKRISNFIETEFLLSTPKKINENIKNIIFVGHVTRNKGIYEIIEVAKALPDLTFNIIGPISKDLSIENLPDNLIFLGLQKPEKVIEFLDYSDVFLLPSYTEGFSIAVLEAMARGLPIITTKVGANLEMLGDQGGKIIEVASADSIKKALKELRPLDYRKQISTYNLETVRKNYTMEIVLMEILEVYKKCLN